MFQCFFQAKHRDNTAEKLKTMHMEIVRVMKKTFEIFKSDGQEVSRQDLCIWKCLLLSMMFILTL